MMTTDPLLRGSAGKRFLGVGLAVLGLWALSSAGVARAAEDLATGPAAAVPFTYDPKGHRDPFIPLVREGQIVTVPGSDMTAMALGVPVLYGILWDAGGNSIALINGTEVKVGGTIAGYKVMEIRKDAVVVSGGTGEPMVLQITFDGAPVETVSGQETTSRKGR